MSRNLLTWGWYSGWLLGSLQVTSSQGCLLETCGSGRPLGVHANKVCRHRPCAPHAGADSFCSTVHTASVVHYKRSSACFSLVFCENCSTGGCIFDVCEERWAPHPSTLPSCCTYAKFLTRVSCWEGDSGTFLSVVPHFQS